MAGLFSGFPLPLQPAVPPARLHDPHAYSYRAADQRLVWWLQVLFGIVLAALGQRLL